MNGWTLQRSFNKFTVLIAIKKWSIVSLWQTQIRHSTVWLNLKALKELLWRILSSWANSKIPTPKSLLSTTKQRMPGKPTFQPSRETSLNQFMTASTNKPIISRTFKFINLRVHLLWLILKPARNTSSQKSIGKRVLKLGASRPKLVSLFTKGTIWSFNAWRSSASSKEKCFWTRERQPRRRT